MLEKEPTLDQGMVFYNYHLKMAKNKILLSGVIYFILMGLFVFLLIIAINMRSTLSIIFLSVIAILILITLIKIIKHVRIVGYLLKTPFDDIELTKKRFYQLMYHYDYESNPIRKYSRQFQRVNTPIMSYLVTNNGSGSEYEHLENAFHMFKEISGID
jgi:glucan phosphoethanolaminetransferase (alkaline phosphatase superfamily)